MSDPTRDPLDSAGSDPTGSDPAGSDPAGGPGVTRTPAGDAPSGAMGQRYLATGTRVGMRLWQQEPGEPKPQAARDYETVGYVVAGRAVLRSEDRDLPLETGDSWVVPAGVRHTYEIVEQLTAVEATSPPAQQQGRDRPPSA